VTAKEREKIMAIETGITRVFVVVAPVLEFPNCSTLKAFYKMKTLS
jgi:hypothetical protein